MSFSFDCSLVEDDLVPEGRYALIISKVEERNSKAGHLMLCFEYTITEGAFEGQRLFDNFLVDHPTAAKFSRQSLKKLSEACLLPKWEDASELKGKAFTAFVSQKEDSQGTIQNKVNKFKPISDQSLEYKVLNVQDIPF